MGIFNFDDPQTGKLYEFTIAGDAPSNTEFGRITQILDQDRIQIAEEYTSLFGEAPEPFDDGTAIGRSGARGYQHVKGAFGETIGTIGEQTGLGFLERYGTDVEERARQKQGLLSLTQPERMQSTDVKDFSSALTFAGETLGDQGATLGLGIAGAVGAAVLAPMLGAGALATSALGLAAYGAAQAPILFGNDVQRQEDEVAAGTKDRVDLGDALTATFGQAVLESISGKLLLKSPFRAVGKNMTGAKGLFVRSSSRFAGGATTESLTEVGQQMMERAQAGLEIDSEEAYAEYREAAIAGGLLGGGVRVTGLGERGDRIPKNPVVPKIDKTPEQEAEAAVEAEADKILADDVQAASDTGISAIPGQETGAATELTDAQKTVVAAEGPEVEEIVKDAKAKVAEYSPEKEVAPTVKTEAQAATPTVITEELLNDLGINSTSPLRTAKKRNIVGLPVTDPKVRKELEEYSDVSNAPKETKDKVAKLLGGIDAGVVAEVESTDGGVGESISSGRDRLEAAGIQAAKLRSPGGVTTSDTDAMGGSGGDAAVSGGPDGSESDTLADDYVGDAIWANNDSDVPVTVLDDAIPGSSLFKKVRDGVGRISSVLRTQLRAVKPKIVEPEAVAALTEEVDALVTEPITPAQAAPQGTPAMELNAIPGQKTGAAQQIIPPAVPPAPRFAPARVEPDPYAALVDIPDVSNEIAQRELDARFYGQKDKLAVKAVKFHEDNPALVTTNDVDPTTTGDKQAISALLNTPPADLKIKKQNLPEAEEQRRESLKGAIAFFGKYRSPAVALEEIGVASRVGEGKSPTSLKTISTDGEAFYYGQTKPNAIAARQWIEANLSPEANSLVTANAQMALRGSVKAPDVDAGINTDPESADGKKRAKLRDEKVALDRAVVSDDAFLFDNDTGFYDSSIEGIDIDAEMMLLNPTQGLNNQLMPTTQNGLRNGDLRASLLSIAGTNPVPRIRKIAAKLAEVVGTTKVQVVDDLSQVTGRTAAGLFDPETNTISIDANNGMNVHTILHEMTHAATSARLANPALPETQQITNLFNLVRKELGDVYGTRSLDEFVAEAFSNPEFQSALALIRVDGGKVSGWEKFTGAVRRIVRKVIGLKPKSPESALDEVDRIINGMLTPSPATRGAPSLMLAANTSKGSIDLAKSAVAAVPSSKRAEYVEMASDVAYNAVETGGGMVKNVVLNSLDSRILTDVAKKKIPFASELNVMIRKMSGAMRDRSDKLDAITNNYAAWARKNKAAAKVMNNIIPKSTQLRVDPSMPRKFYSSYKTTYHDLTTKKAVVKQFKSEKARTAWVQNFNANVDDKKTTKAKNMKDPDPQDLVAYDALRKQYNAMGKEGQAFYRQMRNFFQDTYDEIVPALRARLEATIQDPDARASAFEKLQDILMKESGLIRPYFPLMRKGKHRLQYDFIDENGQRDHSVEYFQNRRELDRAFKLAEQDIAKNVKAGRLEKSTKPAYTRADQPMNFNAVPSSSFVYDILKNMEMSKGSFRDKNGRPDNKAYDAAVQSVVDLALDAMPERSFMQGFRRRGDVRGYIGDTTPTKISGAEFDAATMMREKGRDLNRQIVQIQSAAEIEKFRNKLRDGNYLANPETADIARKLDQMAAFAQKPDVPRWSQQANAIGFNMTMGLNFSSAAITFFDVAMSAMPIISAEYGVVKTGRAYREAMSLITNAPKTRGIMVTGPDNKPIEQEVKMGIIGKSGFNYTYDQLPPKMQKIRLDILLEKSADQGQANQSLTQESLEIGRDAPLEGVNKWTSAMFHHSERVNRETTLIASYALEVQKLQGEGRQLTKQDYKDAAQKAIETTEFTLGSTSAAGRPIWAQSGAGNVIFLFKRFAIAKYYMMYKLGHDSIGTTNIKRIMQEQGVTEAEAKQIATDRKIARIGLRNFMVSTGIMAGVGGMPMMGSIGFIVNLLTDDDEDDFESQVRKFTGEGIYGGLANLIFDAEISSRISLNSLLYRPPFIEKDQSPIWTFAEQMGGPVVGIANNTIRGGTEMLEGLTSKDNLALYRGTETILPSSLRNVMKAFRYGYDGATTRRNDAIIEDISLYNALMQGAGFAPAEYVRELDYNRNIMRRNKTVKERRAKLNKRYNMARMAGDVDEMRKLVAMQEEFNRGLPEAFADREITESTRKKSYASFARNSGNALGGVIHTEAMKQIRDEYNQGFQGF
jgi:hypothetical protein